MEESLSDRVVRVVDAQTTPMQPDSCPEYTVVQLLVANTVHDFRGDDVRDAIATAVDEGRLTRDADGRLRVPDDVDVPRRHAGE